MITLTKDMGAAGDVWTLEVLEYFGSVTQGDEMSLMRFAVGR